MNQQSIYSNKHIPPVSFYSLAFPLPYKGDSPSLSFSFNLYSRLSDDRLPRLDQRPLTLSSPLSGAGPSLLVRPLATDLAPRRGAGTYKNKADNYVAEAVGGGNLSPKQFFPPSMFMLKGIGVKGEEAAGKRGGSGILN